MFLTHTDAWRRARPPRAKCRRESRNYSSKDIIAESAANVTETEPPKPPPDEDESKPPVKEPPTEEPPVKEPPKESLNRFAHAKTVGFAKPSSSTVGA